MFLDGEDVLSFAEFDVFSQPFKEQIDFFTQKRVKPTKVWTDAMRGIHDRAFVIAGATDTAMLSDFQTAISRAMSEGTGLDAFRKDFDRIVEQYGWKYKGEHGWRTRVIFETNIRTSYMAGRLKQMRDPDVIRLRPFWEYRHGETRQPKNPRARHLAWHGTILRHDDPWWNTHFPPNDWLCSCGVRTLSLADLKRRGKSGPDQAPGDLFTPIIDPVTGQLSERPQGVGYGWDYQPGHLWEQGLVPSSLMDQANPLLSNPRMAVSIDAPEPIDTLVAAAKPFAAKPLASGLGAEDYVRAFLKPFGADIGQAVLFEDAAGVKVPVSDQLFRDRQGEFKVFKRERSELLPLLAEALLDPDEIWIGVARKKDPVDAELEELIVDRRYIRADPKTGLLVIFEIGEKFWEGVTAYAALTKTGKPDLKTLDRRRGGKLVYTRPKRKRPR
ncbi:PBECR2 nuclease fold domain-containing protein [Pararhizobium gei]|uniref:PBECR2 nuclease fold domain-containing protein n=1 Tax=Pararhizobium gei TaxID=1395951 RepID=UPI0023DA7149|nr:PBECR2 nuclease fold domain-containing protein [Rhizobium gei]